MFSNIKSIWMLFIYPVRFSHAGSPDWPGVFNSRVRPRFQVSRRYGVQKASWRSPGVRDILFRCVCIGGQEIITVQIIDGPLYSDNCKNFWIFLIKLLFHIIFYSAATVRFYVIVQFFYLFFCLNPNDS